MAEATLRMVEVIDVRLDEHPITSLLAGLADDLGATRWALLWCEDGNWRRLGVPGARDPILAMLAASSPGRLDRVRSADLDGVGPRLCAAGLAQLSALPIDPAMSAVAFFEEPTRGFAPSFDPSPWLAVALESARTATNPPAPELPAWVSDVVAAGNGTLGVSDTLAALAASVDLSSALLALPAPRGLTVIALHTPGGADPEVIETSCPSVEWRALLADPAAAFGWLPARRVAARWSRVVTASDRRSVLAVEGRGSELAGLVTVADLLGQALSTARSNDERHERVRRIERARLASTLHEELSQRLATLTVQIDLLGRQPRASAVLDDLGVLRGGVVHALEALRSAIFELSPPEPDWTDLEAGLERFVDDHAASVGLSVDFEAEGAARPVDAEAVSLLFAAVQEALSNVAKHAGTSRAWVRVAFAADAIEVEVGDDGRGLDETTLSPVDRQHQGLTTLRTRARLAGATLDIDGAPGGGTTVHLVVPTRPAPEATP